MIVRPQPGETAEQFANRVIKTAGPLPDRLMTRVRQLLPPVRRAVDDRRPRTRRAA